MLLESRNEGFWFAAQSAKGSPATVADKRARKVAGDLNVNREDGEENYSDGLRAGDAMDFVNTLSGEGTPVFQAQAGLVGFLYAMMCGSESVAAAGPINYDHVATLGLTGRWLTAWKKVGSTGVGPVRQKFDDDRLVSLRFEASSANKVAKIHPQLLSLDPGKIFGTDPVKALDPDDPMLFTEGEGRCQIGGETHRGRGSLAVVLNDATQLAYGDSVRPHDVGFGVFTGVIEALTLALDAQALELWYEQIYGVSTPVAGLAPLTTIPARQSYTEDLRKGSQQSVSITGGPTGGTFPLTVPGLGGGTVNVPYNSSAAALVAQLEPIVGKGKVTAQGGPLPSSPIHLVFENSIGVLTVTSVGLTGGTTPTAAVQDNGHHRGVKIEVFGIQISPDMSIAGNPDGGLTELPLAAKIRPEAEGFIKVTTRSGDALAY